MTLDAPAVHRSFAALLVLCTVGGTAAFAQSAPPSERQLAQWLKRFPEADANGDGRLTAGEAAEYRRAARGQRGTQNNAKLGPPPPLKLDPRWADSDFPPYAASRLDADATLELYQRGPVARSAPAAPEPLSFPKPTDGGMRIVGVGHSFMAPGYGTLPLITRAAGFEQPLCLHTGGGVTGSARYKWEQENGIFQFDGKPVPKLLAAIANADWEAMILSPYHHDRPEFYTCWIEYCLKYHPEMKFYLSDAWPQIDQLTGAAGVTRVPDSDDVFTPEVIEHMRRERQDESLKLVRAVRAATTERVYVLPTNDAVAAAAKLAAEGKLPGVEGVHRLAGGKERSVWKDRIGHLGPGFDRLEGYVFYATLYRRSPALIDAPIRFRGSSDHPSEKLDALFRRIAWEAVTNHPLSGVTDADGDGVADPEE
ncbi:hypothetical protein [Alienimonas chondri]|uniref:EF-hand domain-containing protein n=1 Tax=Alienimonas chondri TaxID=2681879 RepID=A0ABX1VAG9_9PLAN|nr:hypothetical protein [Alienimonas chondri]NNJ24368.1 hypothetical protein [Alienimonas chondri]